MYKRIQTRRSVHQAYTAVKDAPVKLNEEDYVGGMGQTALITTDPLLLYQNLRRHCNTQSTASEHCWCVKRKNADVPGEVRIYEEV
eukprot:scaffold26471_cov156-Skeletonema_marinoi.AAC.6